MTDNVIFIFLLVKVKPESFNCQVINYNFLFLCILLFSIILRPLTFTLRHNNFNNLIICDKRN